MASAHDAHASHDGAKASALTFTSSAHGLSEAALAGGFFDGWASPPSLDEHLALLRGSSHVALALDDDRVVGFANALSDGILSAYILFSRCCSRTDDRALGRSSFRLLLDEVGELYMVDVMCDDDVVPFYEALGFQHAGGAVRRNYRWRSAH